jgi:hypothetical protein
VAEKAEARLAYVWVRYGCTYRGRKGIYENGGWAERWNDEDDEELIATRALHRAAVCEWVG